MYLYRNISPHCPPLACLMPLWWITLKILQHKNKYDPSRWTIFTSRRFLCSFLVRLAHLQDFQPFNISMIRDVPCYYLQFTTFSKAEGVSVPTCRHDFNQAATRKPSAKKASWNSLTSSKTGLGIVISKDKARLNLNRGCFLKTSFYRKCLITVIEKKGCWPAVQIWPTTRQDVYIICIYISYNPMWIVYIYGIDSTTTLNYTEAFHILNHPEPKTWGEILDS